jgi:5,10-methylenetetrahydromethanopterin reductase
VRIAANIGGEVIGNPTPPQDVVEQVCAAEADGFGSAWSVHLSRGIDTLSVFAAAAARTTTIELGVGVVPTYPRHPLALAQQAATVQALCGGRLTLGVGVSHRPVIEGLHGLSFDSPAAHMRDYLSVLVPLVTGGSVTFQGEFYRVDGGFTVPGTSPISVVVGALAPKMVRVAGELSDGIVTWLAGPAHLEAEIGPWLRAAAREAGRAEPRLIAGMPVAVCDDVQAGRAAADTVFARYLGLENYQKLFAREGATSVGGLAVVGDEDAVRRGLQRFADAGVTELWPIPFPVAGDPSTDDSTATLARAGSLARTRSLLRTLAKVAGPVVG